MGIFNEQGKTEQAILAEAENFKRPDVSEFVYGTAGFRMKEELLDFIVFTVGIVAVLRSKKLSGQTIGVMITASHNRAEDNGVKIVDPQGEMLDQDWEKYATYFSNAKDPEQVLKGYGWCVQEIPINTEKEANVIIGRDTRPSGVRLTDALKAGVTAAGGRYVDYGVLTTPQLHYLVKATNTKDTSNPYGEVSEEGYYKKLAAAFIAALDGVQSNGSVSVDCANGVGAPKLKEFLKHLPSGSKSGVKIRVMNDDIDNPKVLNEQCGADHIKTQNLTPKGFDGEVRDRWASFDGDADRVVYYFIQEGNVFRLLDGDRIATLAANFIGELVLKAGLSEKIKLGVVQTAYANGASTKYIEQVLKLKVDCTNTGVKHLHHVAARSDIGVYFEANGHGTVLFSQSAMKRIYNHEPESPAQLDALNILKALTDLINQTVGDAISDLLLVEVVLAHKEFTVKEWLNTYTDMPNRLKKVHVAKRSAYVTEPGTAERKLKEPVGLQGKIDEVVAKYKEGRCFVRASGTEDAVRVYAEAAETYDVEDMVGKVMELIEHQG